MLKVYEHWPYFHLHNSLPARHFPLDDILSGKTKAYLHLRLSSNSETRFQILPCKRNGNCLFQVLFQFIEQINVNVENTDAVRDAGVKLVLDEDDSASNGMNGLKRKHDESKREAACRSLSDIYAAMKRYNFNVTLVKQVLLVVDLSFTHWRVTL